jgi:hypothetical protein
MIDTTRVLLNLRLEMDGRMMDGYPIVAGLTATTLHHFRLMQADEPDTYEPLPLETLTADVTVLALRPDTTAKFRVGAQTTSNIPIGDRGMLLIFGGTTPMATIATMRVDVSTRLDGMAAS